MNGLEMAIVWLAVQVSVALVPATLLQLWASRRGPAQGAWVAVASMALILVLSLATVCPRPRVDLGDRFPASSLARTSDPAASRVIAPAIGAGGPRRIDESETRYVGLAWSEDRFFRWFETLRRGADRSASRYPRAASVLTSLIVAGMTVGFLRLVIGLGGIGLCRRRGRRIEDPELVGLLEALRVEMGCQDQVELHEVSDLGTAATAGWWHPWILLPDDWRSWDDDERRAALAHELAHIVRADYAAGLVARIALALHFYHPLVRWLTVRLLAQQELAADALGARFAGGRDSYVLALSRLALRQDRRASFWPARAFLPAKGTLIRRIEMLTNLEPKADRSWSRKGRVMTAGLLLAIGAGVLLLPGPSRGGDDPAPKVALKETAGAVKPRDSKPTPAIDLSYLPADAKGFIAFQPSAICRREGMSQLVSRLNGDPESSDMLWFGMMDFNLFPVVHSDLDGSRMPRSNCSFRIDEIEQITADFWIDRGDYKGVEYRRLRSTCQMIRMVDPFDWKKQARVWWPKLEEVRDLPLLYARIHSPHYIGEMCMFIPDDRTLVVGLENQIRDLITRGRPSTPPFIQGSGWEQIQRSLFAMAIDNRDHRMAGILKKKSEPEAVDLSRPFQQADLWAFSLDDSDEFGLRAFAACASTDANRQIVVASDDGTTLSAQRMLIELTALTRTNGLERASEIQTMFAKILEGYEVVPSGTTVNVIPKPSVKLAEVFRVLGQHIAREAAAYEGAKAK